MLVVFLAYLIGSIPVGYLIVRMRGGGDVRQTGSGGTGATNVSRRAGKAAGVLTLILDALKGAIAVFVARVLVNDDARVLVNGDARALVNGEASTWIIAAAAIAVVVGHIFPVWLKFRGGKGVATAAGVFFMLAPFALLCAALVFVGVVALTRYVSLASLAAITLAPFFLWLQKFLIQPAVDIKPLLTAAVAAALLIIFAHRGNIDRLVRGTESKLS